ncbi:G-D-S-L family lipolytic protein [Aurantibacter crassamenti]|uniref:G-D-S-L family lipolytic protein n=1 Tax=Aurantibacter crassamenti TaxID=1837375 RepID=UPI001939B17C|nr:G-D-S-L family lipolytic protein [Aurantibacter crassamenti]MBM1104868.1 G-D-S-L family lipolytic protein [Aurantibacter crassamenti]
MKLKYIGVLGLLVGFIACNEPEDVILEVEGPEMVEVEAPALTAGNADFSNYVAVGASFTAGFTDNGLFKAAQENSFPNILATQMSLAGGGSFSQPLMSDNVGGLIAGGQLVLNPVTNDTLFKPRLVFGGETPVDLKELIGPVTPTTDFVLNNPTGPFNNLGVPGAKSFHLLAPGFGNLANFPAAANPYAIRLTSGSPDASIIELAVAQSPTFFTLSEIGGNDVLGYATTGGDGTNLITPTATFDAALGALVGALTSGGAKGAITNVPYITDLPHFTTVPFNALDPNDEDNGPALVAQIPTLNNVYGALNQIFEVLDPTRVILFSETEANGVVIYDETLIDLSAQITGALSISPAFSIFVQSLGLPEESVSLVATLMGNAYGQARQANENDLLVLPSSSIIGEVNNFSYQALLNFNLPPALAAQFSVDGITLPLIDKWVLLPSEQAEIKTATDAYNSTISSVASSAGLALVDLNSILTTASTSGIEFDEFNMTTNLVTGGLVSLDGIHLTARGYALMANKFLAAIDATYGSNFIAAGAVAKAYDFPTNYSPTLQ